MEGTWGVCLLGLLVLFAQRAAKAMHYPTTDTDSGRVRGVRHTVNGKTFDVYYGIPFAQAPVGELRFKLPVQRDPWPGTWDATRLPNSCIQGIDNMFGNFSGALVWNPNTKTDEDCLYLNIWVPRVRRPINNKAVMIWIYGGGFYSGSSTLDIYEAKYLAVENDVIVVSMQYRVGSLGYLAMGHHEAPGNMGMFDQRLAMEWVRKNIQHFGGNSRNITIFGESAGSVSVGLHLLSPLSRGLFDRAILESGAPQASWATIPMHEAERRGRILAGFSGCDPDASKFEIISCFRKLNATTLMHHEFKTIGGGGVVQFPFIPVVDGNFLVESPDESIRMGRFKKIPLLLGSNANEGSYFLVYYDKIRFNRSLDTKVSRRQFITTMDDMFRTYPRYPEHLNAFGIEAILFQYTHWLDPGNQTMMKHNIEQAVADFNFVCPVNELAQAYANAGQNVYYYKFTHRMSTHNWGNWMGVLHGDEINFVFGEPLDNSKGYLSSEKDLSRRMMRFWTNYAKTGDPNRGPGDMSLGVWPEYKSHSQQYLELSLDLLHQADSDRLQGVGPRTDQCAFWHHYLPRLVAGTADISSVEKDWKQSYDEWKNRYIVDWKSQFDNFLQNYERRFHTCGAP